MTKGQARMAARGVPILPVIAGAAQRRSAQDENSEAANTHRRSMRCGLAFLGLAAMALAALVLMDSRNTQRSLLVGVQKQSFVVSPYQKYCN